MRFPGPVPFLLTISFLSISLLGPVTADRAGIPLDPRAYFDESAQNAIVAWNGSAECLILSTDLQSPADGKLMEILPLPSAPYDIRLGNISSFRNMIRLYNEKAERLNIVPPDSEKALSAAGGPAETAYRGIDVVFSATLGLHNITVIKLESQDDFIRWATAFAGEQGAPDISLGENLNASVGDHLARGICYFVFDVVLVTGQKGTAEPVIYLFNTTYLYYPMKMTYDTLGQNMPDDISIFIIMDGVVRHDRTGTLVISATGGISEYIGFSRSELGSVSGPLGAMFVRSAFVAHLSGTIYGGSYPGREVSDIVIRDGDIRRPGASEMDAQYRRADFLRAIRPLSPSLGYDLLRGLYDPGFLLPEPWLAFIIVGLFLAPVVLGRMFQSMIERGRRKSALWIMWLVLYLLWAGLMLGILLLASVYALSTIGLLVFFLAAAVPLVIVLSLGEHFRYTHFPPGKRTLPAISYGLAAAEVSALVFTPSTTVAFLLAVACLPVSAVAGFLVLLLIAVPRGKKGGS
jgi:hypothetical protein